MTTIKVLAPGTRVHDVSSVHTTGTVKYALVRPSGDIRNFVEWDDAETELGGWHAAVKLCECPDRAHD